MKTIIEMAGEAGIFNGDGDWSSCREEYEGVVKKFAELVRADERDRMCEQLNISKELAHEKAKGNETD